MELLVLTELMISPVFVLPDIPEYTVLQVSFSIICILLALHYICLTTNCLIYEYMRDLEEINIFSKQIYLIIDINITNNT